VTYREFIIFSWSVAFAAITASTAIITANATDTGGSIRNTFQCAAFKKMPDGTWYVGKPTTFRIGTFKKTTFTEQSIGPDFFTFGRADLYKVIERKCGAHSATTAK
jgi:hypothetical protein